MKSTIIRICFSIGLIIGVYSETGIFTTIAMSFIFIGFEILGAKARQMLKE